MSQRYPLGVMALLGLSVCALVAQENRVPSARLVSASRLVLPGAIDSSNPMVWALVEGMPRLFALSSWGGVPALASGPDLAHLQTVGPATFTVHPGHGVWFESIVPSDEGAWYGFYHHERSAEECGRMDRQLPRIGAARSSDRGLTWDDLGIVLEAPPDSTACGSSNRFVLGGVGDVGAMLDPDSQDVYLYFSQYGRGAVKQGVAVARLAWADRDAPVGKVTIWNDGAWLPAARVSAEDEEPARWEYPAGTPLVGATRPFHDGSAAADVFWGASIHWNTYLECYVMLLNRAKDDQFNNDGIYVSYATSLGDPSAWSAPKKILNGGGWYPQAVGLEAGGTDRLAGRRARFFLTGKSEQFIEFER